MQDGIYSVGASGKNASLFKTFLFFLEAKGSDKKRQIIHATFMRPFTLFCILWEFHFVQITSQS